MSDAEQPAGIPTGEPAGDTTIGGLLSRLVDDSEQFVRAEVKLYRAQAILRLLEARTAIVMLAVALVIVLATAIALLVGMILILVPHVGRAGAVAIVVIVSLLVAWLLIQFGLARLRRATDIDKTPGVDEA